MFRAIIASALFLAAAPGTVAFLLPRLIHRGSAPIEALQAWSVQLLGAMLVVAGFLILLDSFARFAIEGLGTPAPPMPTRTLIVTGLYRHVRNPMYVAVIALILGQALLWADTQVLLYGAVVWFIFHLFVLLYEEPALERTFARQYAEFRMNVPRWWPRLSPWTPHGVSH